MVQENKQYTVEKKIGKIKMSIRALLSDDGNSKEIFSSCKSHPVIAATKLCKKGNIVLNEKKKWTT